jgi:AN1-type zinc finger protein 2
VGKHCSVKLCNQLDFLPYLCAACKETFCQDHWKFASHSCQMEHEFRKNVVVPSCPVCQTAIPVPKGKDPNSYVDDHLNSNCSKKPKSFSPAYRNACTVDGCKKKEVIPFKCNKCSLNFCVKHRHPHDHICSQISRKSNAKPSTSSHLISSIAQFASSLFPSSPSNTNDAIEVKS